MGRKLPARYRLATYSPLLVHEVVRVLIQVAVQADDVGLLQHVLGRGHARHRHRRLAVRLEQLTIRLDVRLKVLRYRCANSEGC